MEQARIEVDENNLGRSRSGLAHGMMLLRIGTVAFPVPEWTDFVVVTLSWWCEAATTLLREEASTVDVRFMEGPFLVEIASGSDQQWHLRLVKEGATRTVEGEFDVDMLPLVRSIVDAADRILAACKSTNWWTTDADVLLREVERLRHVMRN